jgi:hypothetical protein
MSRRIEPCETCSANRPPAAGIQIEHGEVGLQVARLPLRDHAQHRIVGVRRRRDDAVGLLRDETMTGWIANMIVMSEGERPRSRRRRGSWRGRRARSARERRQRELDVGVRAREAETAPEPPGEAMTGSPRSNGTALSGPSKAKYSPRWRTESSFVPSA